MLNYLIAFQVAVSISSCMFSFFFFFLQFFFVCWFWFLQREKIVVRKKESFCSDFLPTKQRHQPTRHEQTANLIRRDSSFLQSSVLIVFILAKNTFRG